MIPIKIWKILLEIALRFFNLPFRISYGILKKQVIDVNHFFNKEIKILDIFFVDLLALEFLCPGYLK